MKNLSKKGLIKLHEELKMELQLKKSEKYFDFVGGIQILLKIQTIEKLLNEGDFNEKQ
jgi:hypothetical protein